MSEKGKGKKPKSRKWRLARRIILVTAILGVSALCIFTPFISCVGEALRAAPDPVPEGKETFGKLERINGVAVLTLWGTPYQRGFAHGKLMAQGVLDTLDAVCGSNLLLGDTKDYERKILPMMERFTFAKEDAEELQGVYDGVKAALGDKAVLERIGRALTLEDLKAYNTVGDWYRQACSTFAAWGTRATEGHVWVGRNFDFPPAKAFFSHQMIVRHKRRGDRNAWITVSAPGMIGCITGVNEHHVFVSVHDVFLPLRPLAKDYAPRLLVLRRLMETCKARDLKAQALPILEARRQMFDNSVLLAAPVTDGTDPGVVFEYNGDLSADKGVTVRTSADNEEKLSREMITCINRFDKRAGEDMGYPLIMLSSYRASLMRNVLMAKTKRGLLVDFDIARKTMGAVRLPLTVHTVIVDLNTLDFWYASGQFLSPPGNHDYVKLPVGEWLRE